jgi:hypothetical protein
VQVDRAEAGQLGQRHVRLRLDEARAQHQPVVCANEHARAARLRGRGQEQCKQNN